MILATVGVDVIVDVGGVIVGGNVDIVAIIVIGDEIFFCENCHVILMDDAVVFGEIFHDRKGIKFICGWVAAAAIFVFFSGVVFDLYFVFIGQEGVDLRNPFNFFKKFDRIVVLLLFWWIASFSFKKKNAVAIEVVAAIITMAMDSVVRSV